MNAAHNTKDPNIVAFDAQNRVQIPARAKPFIGALPVEFPINTWLTLDERLRILIFFGPISAIIDYAREQAAERQNVRISELTAFYLNRRECVTADERGRVQISPSLRMAANLHEVNSARLGHLGSCLFLERADRNAEWYAGLQQQLVAK
ncbi:MAG TPA: hypothetical protein PKC67_06430 [Kiritimatiellia bacterium]|nr:hypothetical protein [Kiritimatiellia bacterium]HMP33971.1 hypothetical protein [Kiritimatiellia bacterium]